MMDRIKAFKDYVEDDGIVNFSRDRTFNTISWYYCDKRMCNNCVNESLGVFCFLNEEEYNEIRKLYPEYFI